MQRYAGRIVLICEECGRRSIFTDPEFIRHLERLILECDCGEELTLDERIVQGSPGAGAA